MTGDWKRIGMENEEKSFGELPTLGRTEEAESAGTPRQGPSWSSLGLSEAETLKPPEGIVDDGRTDEARKWKSGEIILNRYVSPLRFASVEMTRGIVILLILSSNKKNNLVNLVNPV